MAITKLRNNNELKAAEILVNFLTGYKDKPAETVELTFIDSIVS
jgi:hypothetical protein